MLYSLTTLGIVKLRPVMNDLLTVKLLMVLASAVILGFASRDIHDYILLSHDPGNRETSSDEE
jgi:hypothetical protein